MRHFIIKSLVPCAPDAASESTLTRGRKKTLKFIDGVETTPAIFEILAKAGMTNGELQEAKKLATRAGVAQHVVSRVTPNAVAMTDCEDFLATVFLHARSKLALRFPDQLGFVFGALDGGAKGTEAAFVLGNFVSRCHDLESGSDRKSTRADDHAALAAMAEAGLTKQTLDAVAKQAEIAMAEPERAPTPSPTPDELADRRNLDLRKLHTWITVWSDTARTVVRRRDHLIRLGIAARRPKKAKPAPVPAPAGVDAGPESKVA